MGQPGLSLPFDGPGCGAIARPPISTDYRFSDTVYTLLYRNYVRRTVKTWLLDGTSSQIILFKGTRKILC